jgi:hypothetical protein
MRSPEGLAEQDIDGTRIWAWLKKPALYPAMDEVQRQHRARSIFILMAHESSLPRGSSAAEGRGRIVFTGGL